MATVRGIVDVVNANTKGKFPMYSIKIGDTWYGTKSKKPNVEKGDFVTLEATQNDKGYWDADFDSIQKSTAPAVATTGASFGAKFGADRERQDSIVMQHSQEMAINWVRFLAERDALPVPASKKAGEKQELYDEILIQYTIGFYNEARKPNVEATGEDAGTEQVVNKATSDSKWDA